MYVVYIKTKEKYEPLRIYSHCYSIDQAKRIVNTLLNLDSVDTWSIQEYVCKL